MIWPFARRRPAHDRVWGPLASAYLDRELTGVEAERFDAHLRGCNACADLLASYRGVDAGLRRRLLSAPPVPARPLFEAAERLGPHPAPVAVPRRLALASAAVLLLGGAATPPVRAGVSGAVEYVREIVAPSSSISYAGQRAVFRAGSDSVLVDAVREFGLYTAADAAATPQRAGDLQFHGGPIFALANGRILFNAAQADGPAQWTTVRRDGSDVRPFFADGSGVAEPAGLVAIAATPDGGRVLFRRPSGSGGFLTTAGATIVTDDGGAVLWSDPGGADVYSLSPDGRYALSGETGGVREIPLDGSAAPPAPISDCDVQRPQTSADGGALVFVAVRIGPDCPAASALYYFRLNGLIGSPYLEPVPLQDGAVFSLSPDGRYVAVQSWLNEPIAGQSGSGATALKLWNLATGERPEIPGFRDVRITQLNWSADGSRLLILDMRDGHAEAWLSDVHGLTRALLPGQAVGGAAFFGDGSGLALSGDGGTAVGLLAVGSPAAGEPIAALLPAGGLVPAFAQHGGAVALLQRAAPPTLLVRHGASPARLGLPVDGFSWAPNGRRAALVSGGEIYLWDAGSGVSARPLLPGRSVAWSPAGSRLLVTRADGTVIVADLRGGVSATAPVALAGAAWSPDGKQVAGVDREGSEHALVLWDPGTGAVRQLSNAARIGAPVWSADGRWLAFATSRDGGAATAQLYVLPVGGGDAYAIAALPAVDDPIVWSADGAALYYLARPNAGVAGALRRVDRDGSGDRRVGQIVAAALFPGPR